jgi:hypothetical protein
LLLFISVEISARCALATEILPLVILSKDLLTNNAINGKLVKVPKIYELILIICKTRKNNTIRKIIQPAKVPSYLSIYFLPRVSDNFPNIEAPIR